MRPILSSSIPKNACRFSSECWIHKRTNWQVHLGGTAPYHPFRRGFDEFFGFTHEGHYFVPEPWEGTTTWLRRALSLEEEKADEHLAR